MLPAEDHPASSRFFSAVLCFFPKILYAVPRQELASDHDLLCGTAVLLFDLLDELPCGLMTDTGGVLEVGRELRANHLGKIDAIIAGDADVLRNPKPHLLKLGQRSERCVIIRTHQDGRWLWKCHELTYRLRGPHHIMEGSGLLVHRIQLDTELLQCSPESIQSLLRNHGHLTMDETDSAMSHLQHVLRQLVLTFEVVGHHRTLIIKRIIDGDGRDLALYELNHLRGGEIHTGDQDTITVSVACMLQEAGLRAGDGVGYEGHIVAELFEGFLRAVQNRCEVLMGES